MAVARRTAPDGEEALPGWGRVAVGFLVAPLLASLPFGPLAPTVLLLYAYPATLLLALPAYLLLRGGVRHTARIFMAGGAVAALVPWLVFVIVTEARRTNGSFTANGVAEVVNGIRTAAGWRHLFLGGFEIAALGAIAGLVFWLCLCAPPPRHLR